MRTLVAISAVLLLAAPDIAQAQGRRDRDDRVERMIGDAARFQGRGDRDDREQRGDRGGRRAQDDARQGVREGRRVPLREVLPQIQRRTPGRILDSFQETGPGGRPLYRVRWQSNSGERIDYIVDAETGAILRRE